MDEQQYWQTKGAEPEYLLVGSPYDPSLADNIFAMMVAMNRASAQQYQGVTYDQDND